MYCHSAKMEENNVLFLSHPTKTPSNCLRLLSVVKTPYGLPATGVNCTLSNSSSGKKMPAILVRKSSMSAKSVIVIFTGRCRRLVMWTTTISVFSLVGVFLLLLLFSSLSSFRSSFGFFVCNDGGGVVFFTSFSTPRSSDSSSALCFLFCVLVVCPTTSSPSLPPPNAILKKSLAEESIAFQRVLKTREAIITKECTCY